MSAPTMPSPTALSGMDPADLASNPYYPPPTSDINGGLPINLDSLRDGPAGSKPFYPYSTLIRYAIKGSPNQKLLLEDIYYAIESRFPYFRTAPSGWKNSVRHNLSLNPCFVKVPRPLTDRGKGSYWTVDDNVDPRTGVHRVRKRRGGKNSAQNADPEAAYEPPGSMGAVEGFSPERYAAGMAVDGAGPSRGPYQYPGFEGVGYPLVAGAGHFEEGEEDQYLPQHDEHGETNWRNVWINELTRMRLWTTEQEKAGLDPEWYRHMVVRLRSALSEPMPGMALAHGAPMPEGHEQA